MQVDSLSPFEDRNDPPLRIGVLCDGASLSAWQTDCLRQVSGLGFAKISLFIVNDQPARRDASLTQKVSKLVKSGLLLWRLYDRRVLAKKVDATRDVPLGAEYDAVARLLCRPQKHGKHRQTLEEQTLSSIRDHDLDVVLRFGFGILSGEVLKIARFGIWSYHHGDPEKFRGAPPGFWEIHEGAPVTGAVLQRLTETLDGGVILNTAFFKTFAGNYPRSLDHLLFGSTSMVANALAALKRDPQGFLARQPVKSAGPIFRYPKNAAVVRFLIRSWGAWLKDQFEALFRFQQWSIGIISIDTNELLDRAKGTDLIASDVRWFIEPKGSFLADPFVLPTESGIHIVAEQYDWRTGVGHLSSFFTEAGSPNGTLTPLLRKTEHLSYPYLLEHDGRTFCAPECAESGKLTIYELVGKTDLTSVGDLILGFSAVDSTIIQFEGRWWLFCTEAGASDKEALHLFFAQDLLGPWQPHALNPVKIDVRSARPAGPIIVHEGNLIRPAQDCSGRYGGAVVFNRITELDPQRFAEEVFGRLSPDLRGSYPAGLHTVSPGRGVTVIDGARLTFRPKSMIRFLGRKLRLTRP